MARWRRAFALCLALTAACGARGDTSPVTPRDGTFAGDTDSGWRLRIDVDGQRLTASLFLPCAAYNSAHVRPDAPFEGQLEGDGSFSLRTETTTEVTTGTDRRSVITFSGRFVSSTRAVGKIDASAVHRTGGGSRSADDCPTVSEDWEAEVTEPPALEQLGWRGYAKVLEPAGEHMAAIYHDGENTSSGGVVLLSLDGEELQRASVTDAGFLAHIGAFDASEDGTLWWVDVVDQRRLIHRLPPGGTVTTFPIERVWDVGIGGDRLWATVIETGPQDLRLVEMSTDGEELASIPVGRTSRVISDSEALWLVPDEEGNSTVFDPETREVLARPALRSLDGRVAVAGKRAWGFSHNGLTSFGLDDESTDHVPLPSDPASVAPDAGGVWVSFPYERALRYVQAGKIRQVIDLPFSPEAIAMAGAGELWIGGDGALWRLEVEGEYE